MPKGGNPLTASCVNFAEKNISNINTNASAKSRSFFTNSDTQRPWLDSEMRRRPLFKAREHYAQPAQTCYAPVLSINGRSIY